MHRPRPFWTVVWGGVGVWLAARQRVWLVDDGLAVLEAKGDARLRID